ncbi:acyl-CoA dehydrogenase C-terminal domain-containing protein [Shewanella surugensis]|uniref:Acyl-CoA dehydrogenase C-terminal domain-containing protein n=1 Tax=Shewanella surugensis TaxID=212020 RepID=A0ABT0LDC1_9GAMM|nr:acyl-CoA dehydrogenase C-terminal domain-containing protein [Shewanella surugensis]MCL1125711.1 acyl-CoA dehydrogenase C-terminal domain-containing protein [Shewanella surugensis]
MTTYVTPIDNMRFLLNDVFDYSSHYASFEQLREVTSDLIDVIVLECGKFCEKELSPLYQSADQEGCHFNDGQVTTPRGFKLAYDKYIQAGWNSLSYPEEFGGQGLPQSLGFIRSGMLSASNWSFNMYLGLTIGAVNTIIAHGTDSQKQQFLPKMSEGRWTGTMCLTEAHCGTDLAQIQTKAIANDDGSYTITGSKMFISAGDHDLTENIIHIVLARLPASPKGTRGLSLYIVPKINITAAGDMLASNHVSCGSIEDKMGIKGSSTAVINFDGAKGYLLGEINKGLECMFTFMNTIRIGTALQGVGATEAAYRLSLNYAKERLSMRALTGKKYPEKVADPLIVHPDVRRMLLTQKVFSEGGLAMVYYACKLSDKIDYHVDEVIRRQSDQKLGLLTPILKAFLTETSVESTNLGMQIFGGHGYIKETGIEQIVRDVRISTIYEGATAIQALDLLGRKILLNKGQELRRFCTEILIFCRKNSIISTSPHSRKMNKLVWPLAKEVLRWQKYTLKIMLKSNKNKDLIGSASVEYLMYSGYLFMGYMWAMMAKTAHDNIDKGLRDPSFNQGKIDTADFYFERIFPRVESLSTTMMKDPYGMMNMSEKAF